MSTDPSITYLSRYDLERHYGVQAGRDSPGFFVGDVSGLNDLVCYWNLRAADISLWFVDPAYRWRYTNIIPSWEKAIRNSVSHRHESDRWIALWTRRENFEEARQLFGEMQLAICQVSST